MSRTRPAHAESMSFLLSQLGANAATRFAAELSAAGLTPRSYAVLSVLQADNPPTQQQLADALGIHRNNMVAIIDGLEEAGWVRRERDAQDRRAFRIRLQPEGAAMAAVGARTAAMLDADLTAGLDAPAVRTLTAQLLTMADRQGLRRGTHPSLSE